MRTESLVQLILSLVVGVVLLAVGVRDAKRDFETGDLVLDWTLIILGIVEIILVVVSLLIGYY